MKLGLLSLSLLFLFVPGLPVFAADSLSRTGAVQGDVRMHDLDTCPCPKCQQTRQTQQWRYDAQWRMCTNMLWQLKRPMELLQGQQLELENTIKQKKEAKLPYAQEQIRLTQITDTLKKAAEKRKEFESKKNLVELQYKAKQQGER